MLGLSEQTRVFLRPGVTDGRLSFEGLRALVVNVIRRDVLLCVGQQYVALNRDHANFTRRPFSLPPHNNRVPLPPRPGIALGPSDGRTWHESCPVTETELLRFGSSARFPTAHGNGNWECPQRA